MNVCLIIVIFLVAVGCVCLEKYFNKSTWFEATRVIAIVFGILIVLVLGLSGAFYFVAECPLC